MVVIAVLALLIAIVAPAMMAAKACARRVLCGSNLHQLSLGFKIYQHENKTFPYGFSNLNITNPGFMPPEGYAGFSSYDRLGRWWLNDLQSSVEFDLNMGSIAWCPARRTSEPSARGNILCGNYGVNRSIFKDAQGSSIFVGEPLKASEVRRPSATLLISDSGYSLLSWLAAANTSDPVFENNDRVDFFYIPGLAFNQTRNELQNKSDAIKGRHPHQTLNVGFADGHHEVRDAESLMINAIPVDQEKLPSLWNP